MQAVTTSRRFWLIVALAIPLIAVVAVEVAQAQPNRGVVWKCSRCNATVGQGPTKPNLSKCPVCGARFAGGGGGGSMVGGGTPTGPTTLGVGMVVIFLVGGAIALAAVLGGICLVVWLVVRSGRSAPPPPRRRRLPDDWDERVGDRMRIDPYVGP